MSVKFGVIIVAILSVFVAKLSIENLNSAQAQESTEVSTIHASTHRIVTLQ